MIIYYSKHAREQMIARGINEKEIREAIQSGTKHLQEDRIVAAYRYFAVVYKVMEKENYFIITVKPR